MEARKNPVILFFAEAVTLAHFARIVSLAKSLDPSTYNIVVASDPRYLDLEKPFPFTFHSIRSIPSEEFNQALAQGRPLYSREALVQYVEEDLAIIDEVKPVLIVGDFRLSLAISAPLRQVPYATVVNAYWSPFADTVYPVPDIPITKLLGVNIAQKLFKAVRPLVFARHARPLNQARSKYGLPSLGHDLRTVYTWADFTLYADIPEVVPMVQKPPNHHYLGPVLWSTKTPLPEWWDELDDDKPIVFVTLGSSGQADLLPMLLQALAEMPMSIIAATAGKSHPTDLPQNVFLSDYLPIDAAVKRSQLLISNGGSLTTYQALASGVPVVGIASNMDQLLNMSALEHLGTGIMVRAGRASHTNITSAVMSVLNDASYAQAASKIAQLLSQYDSGRRFCEIVAEILN